MFCASADLIHRRRYPCCSPPRRLESLVKILLFVPGSVSFVLFLCFFHFIYSIRSWDRKRNRPQHVHDVCPPLVQLVQQSLDVCSVKMKQ